MRKMGKKKGKDVIRKPSFFLYNVLGSIVKLFAFFYWGVRVDRKEIKGLKGPVLAIANHASTIDAVPVLSALLPKRFNLVAAKDLFTWKELKPFIKAFGAIPMTQNGMDLASVRQIKNATDNGRSVLIFPEGKTSLDGRQLYMNPSIAKLAKFLGVPVVSVHVNGAYCTKPRYIKGFRRGRMEAKATLLYTQEELKTAKPAEIFAKIKESLAYNDNEWQIGNKIRFHAKNMTSNLNYVLYKCVRCGAEYRMKAEKDLLTCEACNNVVRLSKYGELLPVGDATTLSRIDVWVDYEKESIKEELASDDFRYEHDVTAFVRDDDKHDYVEIGEGYLFLTKTHIGYVGTKEGAEWRADLSLRGMHTLVTKNAEGIDLNFGDKTYRFLFKEHKYSAKYGFAVETIFDAEHQA